MSAGAPAVEAPHVPLPAAAAVVDALRRSGTLGDYLLYERDGEARLAGAPLATVAVWRDRVTIEHDGERHSEPAVDPIGQVERLLRGLPLADWTAYGYVAFDVARFYSPYPYAIDAPLLALVVPGLELRLPGSERPDAAAPPASNGARPGSSGDGRAAYLDGVARLVEAIRAGRLEKAILSRPLPVPGRLDALATYAAGMRVNPASRSFCFELGGVAGAGFSPETLLEADGLGRVSTNPLAGTRPRGADAASDRRLRAELLADAKEVKEHVLSVRCAEHELRTVCRPGSVTVSGFMDVRRFRCVQHISSRVSGRLGDGASAFDALRALFPGVTVSGIPKRAALDWIGRLEGAPRGVYGGAVGWLDSSGRADLAIAIRSVFSHGGRTGLRAGAGIVDASQPEREYAESAAKMATMLGHVVARDGDD